ncbi:MTRF1L release factor glutamine methyltransferase isoform X5 [Homo sapiens]|nr:MTRF1L release factor glutamine methyltransferase isoform X5 [Homo sapiens]XP_047304243.1 MTRF1L release factor glutamine methyltransferase isoform X5 [Homo sapiens]XP_047304244.1 MTRF1L release factor glutamine methyltransferase isoform X5 [Homo sapiens]XP_054202768.1 MTRF1L release factor glutamine methyltransferase isoform X5 [Homo sapiens]XP_054202769.1 MTRF1L release factor glutamine methyltransferase isoform X5 [Homo sapiens]|eukprot:XP_005265275.1 hemK methyltransferase family member 1 isoform X6 [Homo sapiens]
MELWGRMLWALLSGPGRRGSTRGWAFSSWQPQPPLAGLSSAIELVSHWTGVFEKRGIPEARESSEYIVAHVLGAKTFQSLRPALWTQPLTSQQLQCIRELSSRRLQRMPVQYILGEWDFQGLSLRMVPPVFIPRPETEELVEWVLEEVAQRSHAVGSPGSPLILEVGCGSGAISLSLLSQLPQSRVIAVDKREAAISLTHENAQSYEDPAALDGGEEGMDIITHILALAPRLLKDSGSIFLEVDPRHPELVSSWLQSRPDLYLNLVAVRRDFCGRPRFLHIRRSGP